MYGEVPLGHGAASTEEHEWEMKAGANNILVVIRARPMNEREKRICEDVVSVHEGKLVVVRDPGHFADNIMRKARIRDRKYAFDHAFDHTATQVQVYNSTTRFLIEGVVAGFNATVFAYGPTGTGKTHTMLGQRDNVGIEILTLRDLYAQVARARADGRTVTVTMSLIEVYNENLRDLLAPDAEDTDYLDLREVRPRTCIPIPLRLP
jgi:kinesin family protein 18/19